MTSVEISFVLYEKVFNVAFNEACFQSKVFAAICGKGRWRRVKVATEREPPRAVRCGMGKTQIWRPISLQSNFKRHKTGSKCHWRGPCTLPVSRSTISLDLITLGQNLAMIGVLHWLISSFYLSYLLST